MSWIYVASGGAIGATLRYALSLILPFNGSFPWATWCANIIGCALAGIFLALSEKFVVLQVEWRLFLMVGILGGFTTFSSFGVESFNMLRQQFYGLAFAYVASSFMVGMLCLMLGYALIKWIIT